jgi:hypothetical protein
LPRDGIEEQQAFHPADSREIIRWEMSLNQTQSQILQSRSTVWVHMIRSKTINMVSPGLHACNYLHLKPPNHAQWVHAIVLVQGNKSPDQHLAHDNSGFGHITALNQRPVRPFPTNVKPLPGPLASVDMGTNRTALHESGFPLPFSMGSSLILTLLQDSCPHWATLR